MGIPNRGYKTNHLKYLKHETFREDIMNLVKTPADFIGMEYKLGAIFPSRQLPRPVAKIHSFVRTRNFLLPLQIQMDKITSKFGKVLKIMGIGLLVGISVISCIQVGSTQLKSKSLITCDGESTDTIIMGQERHRSRVFFEFLKKMTFITSAIQTACIDFHLLNSFDLRSLFMNAYQRNVFYVYAFSTVP